MPLRAYIGGEEIIAPLLDDAAWDALRRRVSEEALPVVLPCCGVEGYLRRSKYGTKHFAHKRGAQCAARSETVEHLRAKSDIVLACRSAGFHASTEIAGDGWRADVLASRGAARIAFEVQWSFLRLRDTLYRQRRYARDGIRGCWFFRRPPAPMQRDDGLDVALHARRDLPLFQLYASADGAFQVALNNRLHRLDDFVAALLNGRIRFCDTARSDGTRRARAVFFEMICSRCGARSHLYYVDAAETARCGLRFVPDADWHSSRYAFHPAVLAALAGYRESERGAHLRMGDIKPRGDPEAGSTALSFGCHHCDAPFSREQIALALYGGRRFWDDPAAQAFEATIDARAGGRLAHWCYPPDGRFCCSG